MSDVKEIFDPRFCLGEQEAERNAGGGEWRGEMPLFLQTNTKKGSILELDALRSDRLTFAFQRGWYWTEKIGSWAARNRLAGWEWGWRGSFLCSDIFPGSSRACASPGVCVEPRRRLHVLRVHLSDPCAHTLLCLRAFACKPP